MKTAAVRAVLCCGVLYFVTGIVFGTLAGQAPTHQARVAWRWAAWAISIVGFGAHVGYEQLRLRSSSVVTALHVSSAAGLGAFGLAVSATVHAQVVSPHGPSLLLALSVVIWPVMTALPAFGVALALATLLVRVRPSA